MKRNFIKIAAFVLTLAMMPAAPVMAEEEPKYFSYAYQEGGYVDSLTLVEGEQQDIRFIGVPDYKNFKREWKSSDETVATVDHMGVITAVSRGWADITLEVGDGTVYTSQGVNVMVLDPYNATLGTSWNRNIKECTLDVGESIDFNFYGVKNWNGGKGFWCRWITSNAYVATVDHRGVVTAVADGEATIELRIGTPDNSSCSVQPVVVTVVGNASLQGTDMEEKEDIQKAEWLKDIFFSDVRKKVTVYGKTSRNTDYFVSNEEIWALNPKYAKLVGCDMFFQEEKGYIYGREFLEMSIDYDYLSSIIADEIKDTPEEVERRCEEVCSTYTWPGFEYTETNEYGFPLVCTNGKYTFKLTEEAEIEWSGGHAYFYECSNGYMYKVESYFDHGVRRWIIRR